MAKKIKNIIQQSIKQTVKQSIPKDGRLLEQFVKYQENGLNYRSNDDNINVRNNRGILQLNEDNENNPLLIIEPSSNNILNKSILKVIDTQFNYFKFPATTRIIDTDEEDINLDIDLTIDESEPEADDPIYARYKPSENRKILSDPTGNATPSGILMDELEEGQSQKRINQYYITKQIKESGADLRFRVKINFRYDSFDSDFNTTYFYITRNGPNKFLNRRYKEFFNFEDPFAGGGKISQYQVQNATKDIIIANSEFDIGDTFSIAALSGKNTNDKYSTINAAQTYWSITDASKNVDEWNREI